VVEGRCSAGRLSLQAGYVVGPGCGLAGRVVVRTGRRAGRYCPALASALRQGQARRDWRGGKVAITARNSQCRGTSWHGRQAPFCLLDGFLHAMGLWQLC